MTSPIAKHAPTHRSLWGTRPAPAPPRLGRGRGGFTLIELSMVIFISAILLAVGVVRLGRLSILMSESERVARTLTADLRFAQSEAITTARNHYIAFTDGGTKYTQYAIYKADPGGDIEVRPARPLADSVALTGSATRAEFAPGGDALAAYTYTVTSPGRSYSLSVVLATGVVILAEVP